jgi:hypothetical protein
MLLIMTAMVEISVSFESNVKLPLSDLHKFFSQLSAFGSLGLWLLAFSL